MFRRIFCLTTIAAMFWTVAAITQEKDVFTADSHKERGFSCEMCHKEAEPTTPASGEACLTCHQSLASVAEKTKDFMVNPHDNHMTQMSNLNCTDCHQGHKEDAPMCNQCHEGLKFEKAPAETE